MHCSSQQAVLWLKEESVHVAGGHLRDRATGEYNLPLTSSIFGEKERLCGLRSRSGSRDWSCDEAIRSGHVLSPIWEDSGLQSSTGNEARAPAICLITIYERPEASESVAGYELIRVPLHQTGRAGGEYEDFLTGFVLDDGNVWGRPVGVAVAQDGSLLVSDDGSNSIWRISYPGE